MGHAYADTHPPLRCPGLLSTIVNNVEARDALVSDSCLDESKPPRQRGQRNSADSGLLLPRESFENSLSEFCKPRAVTEQLHELRADGALCLGQVDLLVGVLPVALVDEAYLEARARILLPELNPSAHQYLRPTLLLLDMRS